jgi:hypothetical protein
MYNRVGGVRTWNHHEEGTAPPLRGERRPENDAARDGETELDSEPALPPMLTRSGLPPVGESALLSLRSRPLRISIPPALAFAFFAAFTATFDSRAPPRRTGGSNSSTPPGKTSRSGPGSEVLSSEMSA